MISSFSARDYVTVTFLSRGSKPSGPQSEITFPDASRKVIVNAADCDGLLDYTALT